jgi:membrane-bound lytic murein transglycosylase D
VTLAEALAGYTALNVAIAVGACGLFALEARRLCARQMLALHYGTALAVVVSLALFACLPSVEWTTPSASVWSAQTFDDFKSDPRGVAGESLLALGNETRVVDAGSVSQAWIATALALLALGVIALVADVGALRRVRARAQRVRRIGRVSVWMSDDEITPFSWWRPGSAEVIVPSYLLETPGALRLAVAHELQHHRQRDTLWLYVFWSLRLACALNPFVHLWNARLARFQEFACDAAVIARRRAALPQYADCLVAVASRERHGEFGCATSLVSFGDPKLLTRRIKEMMYANNPRTARRVRSRATQVLVLAGFVAAMTVGAYASSGWVQDRRVTLDEARELATLAAPASGIATPGFEIVVNEEVLHELNRYVGTPEGRTFMRAALVRKQEHEAAVTAALAKHGVPARLASIPLVESGYAVRLASENRLAGAGLWQFLPVTARAFGLAVNPQRDDRLDPALDSDAAARYLKMSSMRFNDWQLAVLAYNMGERGVQEAIESTGSRDAWTLVRSGFEGDRGYLARVHAASIIAANPQMVTP